MCEGVRDLHDNMFRHLLEAICDLVQFQVSEEIDFFCKEISVNGTVCKCYIVVEEDYWYDEEGWVNEDGKIKGFPLDDLLNRRIDRILYEYVNRIENELYEYTDVITCAGFVYAQFFSGELY